MTFPGCAQVTLSSVSEYREAARALMLYAVNGDSGRPYTGDAIYDAVTENRQRQALAAGQFYSSCGDLCHWLLYRLGFRFPWINRNEPGAHPGGWKVAWNITYLVGPANPFALRYDAATLAPEPGDVVHQKGSFDHVRCVEKFDGRTLDSCDYGQPGGAHKRGIVYDGAGHFNQSRILNWLPLSKLIAAGAAAPAEVPIGSPDPPPASRTLREGMVGDDVKDVQVIVGATADGIWGPKTTASVKIWQSAHHLVADGIWGPKSREAAGQR